MILFLTLLAIIPIGINAQIKTKQVGANQILNQDAYRQHNQTDLTFHQTYNVEYPALTIPPSRQQVPVYVDPTIKFLNETRSRMPNGICITEVPTKSLVRDGSMIPAGNGSNPNLSKIKICCDGYERNIHNVMHCDPICTNECINGLCVAPNVCVCYPDHVRNYAGFCLPTCPIGCGNGECMSDNSCKCKNGYALDISRKFCAPVCSKGCLNGNCTAPEICECNPKYELSLEGRCEPKCENCLNGRCMEPGVCTCMIGYERRNEECKPVCHKDCHNGYCSAPNTCGCRPGFQLDESGSMCVAHCDRACLNGFCSGENQCTCNNGYVRDAVDPFMCVPHCPQGCTNGFCSSPNFCICKLGYIKSGVKGRQECVPASG